MQKNIKDIFAENKLADIGIEDIREYIGVDTKQQKFYGAKCRSCSCGHCEGSGGCGNCGSSCRGGCGYSNKRNI